ncbi:MAG: hypothetical protein HS115_16715 [Spirochaetales bacterium]|nr:hypothetical protein [Spirochaetales bacterium]
MQNLSMELFNHQHYWESLSLRPGPAGQALLQEAEKSFGSFELLLEGLRQQFEAMNPGWLYLSHGEHLRIGFADHPLLSGETMLLCIDGWEHAYYLDYQHRRMDYLQALLLKLVDWAKVNQRLLQANKPGTDSLLA